MPVIDRRKVSAAALSRLSAEPVVREHVGAQLLAAVERGRLLDAARREDLAARRLGRQVNAEVLAEGAVRLVRGEQPPIPGQFGTSDGSGSGDGARGVSWLNRATRRRNAISTLPEGGVLRHTLKKSVVPAWGSVETLSFA